MGVSHLLKESDLLARTQWQKHTWALEVQVLAGEYEFLSPLMNLWLLHVCLAELRQRETRPCAEEWARSKLKPVKRPFRCLWPWERDKLEPSAISETSLERFTSIEYSNPALSMSATIRISVICVEEMSDWNNLKKWWIKWSQTFTTKDMCCS